MAELALVRARPGLSAQVVGGFLLLQLIFVRAISAANANYVSLFGHELHWICWFKTVTGIPCPACGMSRSVILTLHGDLRTAFQINFAGPPLVLGLVVFALGLLFFANQRSSSTGESQAPINSWIGRCSIGYGIVLLAVVISNWITRILA